MEKKEKLRKKANPVDSSIDLATQQMIARAQVPVVMVLPVQWKAC